MIDFRESELRLEAAAERWNVSIHEVDVTPTSLIGFGVRQGHEVVLKVVRDAGDEWDGGRVAAAFMGQGMVSVLAHAPGEVLLERLRPATSLAELTLSGRDVEAMQISASVLNAMMQISPRTDGVPAAQSWGRAFDLYLESRDRQIDAGLIQDAKARYAELCRTQSVARLCHGDFQHYNILLDTRRGWTAIDPKGVIAEPEFEIGPLLRNPHGVPSLYSSPDAIRRRIDRIASTIDVDVDRVIGWAFSQAVLSMIWTIKDERVLDRYNPARLLASTMAITLE